MAYSDDIVQLYQQQYGRAPDANELNYHLNAFNSGQSNAQSLVAALQAAQQPAAAPAPAPAPAPIPEWQQLNNARDAGAQSAGYSDWNSWYQANPMQASMSGINDAFKQTGQDAYFNDPNANVQAFGGYTKDALGNLVAPGTNVASYNSAVNPVYGGTGPTTLQEIINQSPASPQTASDATTTQATQTNTTSNNSWLSGAQNWLNSGNTGTTGGSYYDQATNKYFMPVFGQGGYDASVGDYVAGAQTGWRGYDRLPGTNSSDYSNTPFTEYDITGKQTGTGQFGEIGKSDWIQNLALAGLIAGGGAVLGNAVGLIGAPGAGSSGASVGGAGGFIGEGAASGVPAWDAALGGAELGSGAAAAGAGAGASGVGTAGAGAAGATGLGSTIKTIADTVKTATGGTGGTNSLAGLIPILAGLLDRNKQNNASESMLNWLNTQQGKIDSLYAPGSAETNLLRQTLERKDAAAGRNSQYGPREVELAGKIAQIKADATARLTSGIAGNYSSALNQGASSNAGLLSALGATGNPITNLSSFISDLTNIFSKMDLGKWSDLTNADDTVIDDFINGFV